MGNIIFVNQAFKTIFKGCDQWENVFYLAVFLSHCHETVPITACSHFYRLQWHLLKPFNVKDPQNAARQD